MLEHVLELWQRGFNVIPLTRGSKRAKGKWKEFQTRRVTVEEVRRWWGGDQHPGVAIVTGAVSGIIVLDVDVRRGGHETIEGYSFPHTLAVTTPSGGKHYYFRHPGGHIANRDDILPGVDLKADGGYVVAPPTALASGKYTWDDPSAPLAEAPRWLLELLAGKSNGGVGDEQDDGWYTDLLRGVPVGNRDNAAIRLVGRWVRRGLSDEEILILLLDWNCRNMPPVGQHPGDPDPVEWAKEKIASARRMDEERKASGDAPARIIEQLRAAKQAGNVAQVSALLKELQVVLQGRTDVEQVYYLDMARKVSGISKSVLTKLFTKKDDSNGPPAPTPLQVPRRLSLRLSQDYDGEVLYYGVWLPNRPDAVSPEDFSFWLVQSDRTVKRVDTDGSALPYDYARWSVDAATPYNVFEFLNGSRDVDARQLVDELADMFGAHVWYPHKDTPLILALWTMGTYVYTCFDAVGYLVFTGAKRAGKTQTLEILSQLCFNAVSASSISAAALARLIENGGNTVLFDESDVLSIVYSKAGIDDRMSILLNGYKRYSGKYLRAESSGDSYRPVGYDVYGPKAFASMFNLPDMLVDRSITVRVSRKTADVVTKDLVMYQIANTFQLLRNKLYFFGLTHAAKLLSNRDRAVNLLREAGVRDRECEVWTIPATIALTVGGQSLLQKVVDYAITNTVEKAGNEAHTYASAVVWACWTLLTSGGDDRETAPVEVEVAGGWYLRRTIRELTAKYLGVDPQTVSAERVARELVNTGIIDNSSRYRKQLWRNPYRGERAYLLQKDRVFEAVRKFNTGDIFYPSGEDTDDA